MLRTFLFSFFFIIFMSYISVRLIFCFEGEDYFYLRSRNVRFHSLSLSERILFQWSVIIFYFVTHSWSFRDSNSCVKFSKRTSTSFSCSPFHKSFCSPSITGNSYSKNLFLSICSIELKSRLLYRHSKSCFLWYRVKNSSLLMSIWAGLIGDWEALNFSISTFILSGRRTFR